MWPQQLLISEEHLSHLVWAILVDFYQVSHSSSPAGAEAAFRIYSRILGLAPRPKVGGFKCMTAAESRCRAESDEDHGTKRLHVKHQCEHRKSLMNVFFSIWLLLCREPLFTSLAAGQSVYLAVLNTITSGTYNCKKTMTG